MKLSRLVKSFCEETSLHGLKYIFDPSRHSLERYVQILAMYNGLPCQTAYMSLGQKVNENKFLAESGHTLTYPWTADIAQYEVTYVGVAKFGALWTCYKIHTWMVQ